MPLLPAQRHQHACVPETPDQLDAFANMGFGLVLLVLRAGCHSSCHRPLWSQVLVGGMLLMLALWAVVRTAPSTMWRCLSVMTVTALALFTSAARSLKPMNCEPLWFLTGGGH